MTMRLHEKRGEGVMLVLMGAMIVGGIIVWLATGDFHMMPMMGRNHMKQESAGAHGEEQKKAHMSSKEGHDAEVEEHVENGEHGGRSGIDTP